MLRRESRSSDALELALDCLECCSSFLPEGGAVDGRDLLEEDTVLCLVEPVLEAVCLELRLPAVEGALLCLLEADAGLLILPLLDLLPSSG